MIFGRKKFLDPDDEAWHLDTWRCLLENFGGMTRLKRAPLVKPTREFFPPTDASGEGRAEHIFHCVKQIAGMSDWPCKLLAQPHSPQARVGEIAALKFEKSSPLGTFSAKDGEATITYDPKSVTEPATLVATFIHELAHYRLANIRVLLPGGEEMHEYATDLMTVFLGFGVFGANRAFNFSQHGDAFSQGWQWSRQGYLRERDWAFALAVFLDLRGEKPGTLKELLKPHLYSDMKGAGRYLAKNAGLLEQHRAL